MQFGIALLTIATYGVNKNRVGCIKVRSTPYQQGLEPTLLLLDAWSPLDGAAIGQNFQKTIN